MSLSKITRGSTAAISFSPVDTDGRAVDLTNAVPAIAVSETTIPSETPISLTANVVGSAVEAAMTAEAWAQYADATVLIVRLTLTASATLVSEPLMLEII